MQRPAGLHQGTTMGGHELKTALDHGGILFGIELFGWHDNKHQKMHTLAPSPERVKHARAFISTTNNSDNTNQEKRAVVSFESIHLYCSITPSTAQGHKQAKHKRFVSSKTAWTEHDGHLPSPAYR